MWGKLVAQAGSRHTNLPYELPSNIHSRHQPPPFGPHHYISYPQLPPVGPSFSRFEL